MTLNDAPALLIICGATVITGALVYAAMNANQVHAWWRQRHTPRAHGPWCITAHRPPFGIQILFQSAGQRKAVKWKNRNRNDRPTPLGLMTRDEVDRRNAEIMASQEFWSLVCALTPFVDEAVRRAEVNPPDPTTPVTAILTIPAIAQERVMQQVDQLIAEAQMVADGMRTLRRKMEIPNEWT